MDGFTTGDDRMPCECGNTTLIENSDFESYWDETEALKGFTKEEKIFLKGCFEKMGISSKDAQEWLNTFMIKKTPQSGKLGSWTYSKGNSKNQVISLINNNENNNYVNFYKKSKGNN